jgi:hypothetical protein
MTFTFTAHILVPAGTAGGTVKYRWYRSDGASSSSDQTVTFAAGETSKTVTTTWQLGAIWGNGSPFWEQAKATVPNVWYSPHGTFSFNCHFSVTSVSVNVSPTSYPCVDAVHQFNFAGTLNVSPVPTATTVTYHWARSDGALAPNHTVVVPAGASSVPISDGEYWDIGKAAGNGSYWEQVVITAPVSAHSNQATFTISC